MKKLFFSLMMVCMMVMSCGVVWADLIMLGDTPPTNFGDFLGEGLGIYAMITIIAILFYIVLSLIIFIKKIGLMCEKDENNNSKLESVYWMFGGCLSVMLFPWMIVNYTIDFIYNAIFMFIICLGSYIYSCIRKDKKLLHKNIIRVILVILITCFTTLDLPLLMLEYINEIFLLFWIISHNFVYHENTKKGLLKNIIISILTFFSVDYFCSADFHDISFLLIILIMIFKLLEKKLNLEKFSMLMRKVLDNIFIRVLMSTITIGIVHFICNLTSNL